MTESRTYYDEINNETIHFKTNAKQSTIDALKFNGEWDDVRKILIEWGYTVVENPCNN